MNKIKDRIQELINLINYHDRKYYLEAQLEISDFEYDQLFKELKNLEEAHPAYLQTNSPTQRAGGTPLDHFQQVAHKIPMLSLDNTYSKEELMEFDRRVKKLLKEDKIEYVAELKIDGVGASLIYKDGLFVQGVTRGDGLKGDDITLNLKTIHSIPLSLKEKVSFEVRGEVLLKKSDFIKINEERIKNNELPFANPRNATAGTLHLLDSKEVSKRRLSIFIHSVCYLENEQFTTYEESIKKFERLGLVTERHRKLCRRIEEVITYCQECEEIKNKLDYEVDGMVVKVNLISHQRILGFTARSPRWAIAYKFTAQQGTTIIKDIIIQVGRTGVLTPVAILEPVRIAGAWIKKATLHNEDEIKRKDVRVNDRVIVERSGDVIPKIVAVLPSKERSSSFEFPKSCPVCGSSVVRKTDDAKTFCPSVDCQAQVKRRIAYFASKSCLDIDGLGEKIVDQLVEEKIITNISSLYQIYQEKEKILSLEGWQERSFQNLCQSIEASKKASLAKLINALGIPNVGSQTAQVLVSYFSSLKRLMEVSLEELMEIKDVGPAVAERIVNFFSQKETKDLVTDLESYGFECLKKEDKRQEIKENIFLDKELVITGNLKEITREKAKEIIREMGGKINSEVGRNTDYLIVGEKPGSKLKKAKELGIKILEAEIFKEEIKRWLVS
ncbi:NAD-dependent DNA ligase LigA [bacterium]|nr:NAD-dependent DNA ligase LigA [bacterium]